MLNYNYGYVYLCVHVARCVCCVCESKFIPTCSIYSSCGLEAEECWNLVQSFTHYHNLPPSLAFVTLCAKHGEWLPLLCHAEIFKIPPNKVTLCAHVFKQKKEAVHNFCV